MKILMIGSSYQEKQDYTGWNNLNRSDDPKGVA